MAVVSRFLDEVWNQGKVETIDELYHTDGVALGMGEDFKNGPAMFKAFHQMMYATCNGFDVRVTDMMAQGNKVSYYATFDFVHKATGKKLHMEGGGIGRLSDGKIMEAWNALNFMDVLIQLGTLPEDVLPKALMETK